METKPIKISDTKNINDEEDPIFAETNRLLSESACAFCENGIFIYKKFFYITQKILTEL